MGEMLSARLVAMLTTVLIDPHFLSSRDRLLWLHSIFALIYFILTILCMAHHSVHLEYRENEKVRNQPSSNPALFSANGLLALHKCWSQ